MGYFNNVALPTQEAAPAAAPITPTPSSGGYFSKVSVPTAAASSQSAKEQSIAAEAAVSKAASDKANSPLGLAESTIENIPSEVGGEIKNAFDSGIAQRDKGIKQIIEDPNIIHKVEGIGDATVGSFGAATAPIGGLIGKPISDVEDFVSSNPEVQKFALAHPDIGTERQADDVSNASNIALMILGGVEGVRNIVKGKVPLDGTAAPADGSGGAPTATGGAPKPVLNPAEADTFSKTSQLPQTFEHGADAETANLIRTNGFKASSDFPGNGMVSLTEDFKTAQNYADLTGKEGEVLPVRVNAQNVKTYGSIAEYEDAIEKSDGDTAGEKETNLNSPYDAVVIKRPEGDLTLVKADKAAVVSGGELKSLPKAPDDFVPVEPTLKAKPETPNLVKDGYLDRVAKPGEAAKPTKTASDISQALVKKGFEALPDEKQASYTPQSYKAVAEKVGSMMDENIENVKSMATGKTPIPRDVNPEILFNAVEAHALKTGDVDLLRELADSPVSKTSEAGQTLGAHGYNDNPNSAVDLIKSVKKAREGAIIKKGKTVPEAEKEVKDVEEKSLEAEVKANSSKRPTWEEFIKELQCNS